MTDLVYIILYVIEVFVGAMFVASAIQNFKKQRHFLFGVDFMFSCSSVISLANIIQIYLAK